MAHQIGASGRASVITRNDMATVLGFERQKELLGCAENSKSCLAELAGAFGVDYLLAGDVAKLSKKRFSATLKLLESGTGRVIFAREVRATDEEGLVRELDVAAAALVAVLVERAPPVRAAPEVRVDPRVTLEPTPAVDRSPREFNWLPAWPTGAGLLVAAAGAVFLVRSTLELSALGALADAPTASDALSRGSTLVANGKRDAWLGSIFTGVGALAVVTGVIWWLIAPERRAAVTLSPQLGANGASLTLGVEWP